MEERVKIRRRSVAPLMTSSVVRDVTSARPAVRYIPDAIVVKDGRRPSALRPRRHAAKEEYSSIPLQNFREIYIGQWTVSHLKIHLLTSSSRAGTEPQ